MKRYGLAFAFLSLTACQSGTSDFQSVYNSCSQNGMNKNVDLVNACINYQTSAQQAYTERRRAGLANASAILLANNPPPRQPLHCTTTTSGPFTNTNCY